MFTPKQEAQLKWWGQFQFLVSEYRDIYTQNLPRTYLRDQAIQVRIERGKQMTPEEILHWLEDVNRHFFGFVIDKMKRAAKTGPTQPIQP